MPRYFKMIGVAVLSIALLPSLGFTASKEEDVKKAKEAIAEFLKADKGLQAFLDSAYAYAVFPSVGKGAIGVGGAHGNGTVFVGGQPVAKTQLTQVTIGLQLGGQAYREILFFKSKDAFISFQQGELKLSGQASAVAATAGASADLNYSDGVAITTMAKGGLMYEASVGGQHFEYEPYEEKKEKEKDKDKDKEDESQEKESDEKED